MKYICQKFDLPDHWYPKDLQKKARVEEALSWFPMNLRCQAFLFAVSRLDGSLTYFYIQCYGMLLVALYYSVNADNNVNIVDILTNSYFFPIDQCVMPKRTGEKMPEPILKRSQETLKKSVSVVENYFLKNRKFVAGDEISIADLAFFGEITNYWKMGKNLCEGNSSMTQWIQDCKEVFGSSFDELYKEQFELIEKKVFFTEMDYY